jgi:hypothetical protein
MKKYQLLILFTLSITFNSFGQRKIKTSTANKASKLVGTWKLIEFADLDSTRSTWIYPYGKNPKGYFTYTQNGIVNLNICSETPLKISEDSAKHYHINLLDWAYQYSLGYFGSYSVDFNKSIITHHVTGGSMPWYIDTDQPRPFILKGDTLIIGDSKTWKRVLVKTE